MSIRTLAFCLALLCAFLLAIGPARADDEAQLEVATLDVSDLLVPIRASHAPILDVWPSNFTPPERGSPSDRTVGPWLGDGEIMSLLQMHVDPQSWDTVDGADLRIRNGRLRVRNRPAVVRDVRRYIQALRAHAAQRVRVHLGVRRGSAGGYPAAAGGAVEEHSASLELTPYVARGIEIVDRRLYVQDYEVEIAQGSIIANPVRLDLLSGLAAELTATPTVRGDQIVISGVVQHAKLLGLRSVDSGVDEEYLARPYRSDEKMRNGIVELPKLQTTAIVLNTVVTPGAELRVPVLYGNAQQDVWLRAQRSEGAHAPGLQSIGGLGLRPCEGYVGWSHDMYGWRSPKAGFPTLVIPKRDDVDAPEQAEDLLEDLRESVLPPDGPEAATAFVLRSDLLTLSGKPDAFERVRAYLMREEQASLRGATVDVRILSVPSGGEIPTGPGQQVSADGTELLAAGRIPTLHGRRGALLSGTQEAFLADYDVEVAQDARIADPIVDVCFDGLILNLRPHYAEGADTAEIALQLLYSTQRVAATPYESGTRYLGPMDRVEGAVRQFETSIRMPLAGAYVIDAGKDPRLGGRRLLIQLTLLPR